MCVFFCALGGVFYALIFCYFFLKVLLASGKGDFGGPTNYSPETKTCPPRLPRRRITFAFVGSRGEEEARRRRLRRRRRRRPFFSRRGVRRPLHREEEDRIDSFWIIVRRRARAGEEEEKEEQRPREVART